VTIAKFLLAIFELVLFRTQPSKYL
jgi:hypothetical protein